MAKIIHYATFKLREWRDAKNWTREQLADFLTLELGKNVSKSTIEKWEKQERGIDAYTALDIAKALKMQVTDLVERKDGETNN